MNKFTVCLISVILLSTVLLFQYLTVIVVDMIYLMDNCLSFEVDREKEFAPVKNATGRNCAYNYNRST